MTDEVGMHKNKHRSASTTSFFAPHHPSMVRRLTKPGLSKHDLAHNIHRIRKTPQAILHPLYWFVPGRHNNRRYIKGASKVRAASVTPSPPPQPRRRRNHLARRAGRARVREEGRCCRGKIATPLASTPSRSSSTPEDLCKRRTPPGPRSSRAARHRLEAMEALMLVAFRAVERGALRPCVDPRTLKTPHKPLKWPNHNHQPRSETGYQRRPRGRKS